MSGQTGFQQSYELFKKASKWWAPGLSFRTPGADWIGDSEGGLGKGFRGFG